MAERLQNRQDDEVNSQSSSSSQSVSQTAHVSFFTGSIEEAIGLIKKENRCLLMYIFDSDALSKKYETMLSSAEVRPHLEAFICMKLESTSNSAMDFSAFYPVLCVPTIYVISPAGVALEAIIGECTAEDFILRIQKAIDLAKSKTVSIDNSQNEGASASDNLPDWDTRVKAMEEKMDEKQTEKERERIEKQKQQEIERRNAGRSLGRLRSAQLEAEERERVEEVRRERLARHRQLNKPAAEKAESNSTEVLQNNDIEDVREEKRNQYYAQKQAALSARREKQNAVSEAELAEQAKLVEERMKRARIQIRCADGRVFVRDLSSESTLQDLRDSILPEVQEPEGFRLATAYPRHIFTAEENTASLQALGLAPSASLLILPPIESRSGSTTAALRPLWGILELLLLPLSLLKFLGSFLGIFATRPASSSPPSQSSASPASSQSGKNRDPVSMQREGNMMRLRNIRDDEDKDNATWNGNSTQQM